MISRQDSKNNIQNSAHNKDPWFYKPLILNIKRPVTWTPNTNTWLRVTQLTGFPIMLQRFFLLILYLKYERRFYSTM